MVKAYRAAGLACVLFCSFGANTLRATELVDPMRPLDYQVSAPDTNKTAEDEQLKTASWKLTAVLLSKNRSVAVINDHFLQPGDDLEGYTLKSIYEDRVVLTGKGKELVLRRSGTGLKKKAVDRK